VSGTHIALPEDLVDKRRGRDSFEESLERALNKGVSLPAADRLAAMTTGNGEDRLDVVVKASQPLSDLPPTAFPTVS
jgi:hypothetical protein